MNRIMHPLNNLRRNKIIRATTQLIFHKINVKRILIKNRNKNIKFKKMLQKFTNLYSFNQNLLDNKLVKQTIKENLKYKIIYSINRDVDAIYLLKSFTRVFSFRAYG